MNSYFRYAKVLALLLVMTGCDTSNTQLTLADGQISTVTPEDLRAVPADDLTAEVTIGDITTTYLGRDFPDGVWNITLDVEADRYYSVLVRWFASGHLVMEESGTIFTDRDNPTITPDLDFTTFGDDRFDTDCDGIPNIGEINAETDPGSSSLAPCFQSLPIPDPAAEYLPWFSQNLRNYDSINIAERVTSIEQRIFIRDTNSIQPSFYSMVFNSINSFTQPDGSQQSARATLQLNHSASAELGSISFFTAHTLNAIPGSAAVTCVPNDQSGIYCYLPFQLSMQQWYSLRMIEISPSQWQGWVDDHITGESVLIATMEVHPETIWRGHSVDLGYQNSATAQQCSQGLTKITSRFEEAIINNSVALTTTNVARGECVDLGIKPTNSSWSGGSKIINGKRLYTLSLGN